MPGLQYTIPERIVPGKRLGRSVDHDPRSLRYLVKPTAHAARTVRWERRTPVLDQGDLGSCTGNATVGVLGTTPYFETLPAGVQLDETAAVKIYSTATGLDDISGSYPPEDTGSSGLAAAKAAQNAGLISGYQHATSVDAVITALQTGPVITGVNWYSGFDNPDAHGRVTLSGTVRGGHEFEIIGVDLEARVLEAVNSWGPDWGLGGHFFPTLTDYERLLREDGDATVFVPLSRPAPVPTPTPADNVDAALVAAGNVWAPSVLSRLTKAGRFKTAFIGWKSAKGYQ